MDIAEHRMDIALATGLLFPDVTTNFVQPNDTKRGAVFV